MRVSEENLHRAPTRAATAPPLIVPLNDLSRQTDALSAPIQEAVERAVAGGRYLFGPQVSDFEHEFAAYCRVPYCVSVANGTDALELALRALGCGPGSEVVTVANAGMYGSVAVLLAGARPVFADIDPATMTMAPEVLAGCLGERTAAVIVTHLYGGLADIEALCAIARERNIPVVEDCAQAHGAQRNGRRAGAFGDIGCFSFYPTKNLGALGDAGAVVTRNDDLAATLRELRQYGWTSKYHAARPFGRNSRMDEIQAAVLRVKLPHLEQWNDRRRAIVRRYREAAQGLLAFPDASGWDHVAHLCVVRSPVRDRLRHHLERDGIATDVHYPVPDHQQAALREVLPRTYSLPATEQAAGEILTLPCFPELREDEMAHVCASLERFVSLEGRA
jgi:dTDP-3-amino-2,3,6-trideoxy-4-keto-D-glucose/dTDP-3-amino-3,4,6-trideoxy-alpha-D-glucose/dTDP-2,6-dideoxy-D-kanosamine transaminase